MAKHIEVFKTKHLQSSESIAAFTDGYIGKMMGSGKDAQKNGVFIITNDRAIFYRKGLLGEILETIPLKMITSIERKSFLGIRTIRLHTSHDQLEVKILNADAETQLCIAIEAGRQAATKPSNVTSDIDPIERLTMLADLKEKGLLTEAEFNDKKQKILSDI